VNREEVLRLLAEACLSREGRAKLPLFGAGGRRMGVYRTLVRTNLGSTAFKLLPRTRRLVNSLANDAFDDGVVDFLHDAAPRSPLLRDVVFELAEFLRARWTADPRIAPWAIELLDFETLLFAAEVAEGPAPLTATALEPSSRFRLAAGAALRTYAFALHEVDDDGETANIVAPRQAGTRLAISRDAEDVVHTTVLDERAYRVADALARGGTLAEAVAVADALGEAHASREALASALSDLAQRGVFAAP
jgi:hypothetical protein